MSIESKSTFEPGQLIRVVAGDDYFERTNSVTVNHVALESFYGFKSSSKESTDFIHNCEQSNRFRSSYSYSNWGDKKRQGVKLIDPNLGELPIHFLSQVYPENVFNQVVDYCKDKAEIVEYLLETRFKNILNRFEWDAAMSNLMQSYLERTEQVWFTVGVPTIDISNVDGILNRTNYCKVRINYFDLTKGQQFVDPGLERYSLSYSFPELGRESDALPSRLFSFGSEAAHGDVGIVLGEYKLVYESQGLHSPSYRLTEDKHNISLGEGEFFRFQRYPAGTYYRVLCKERNSTTHKEHLIHKNNLELCVDESKIHGEEWRNHLYLPVLPIIDQFTELKDERGLSLEYNDGNYLVSHKELILSEITKYWYKDAYVLLEQTLGNQ